MGDIIGRGFGRFDFHALRIVQVCMREFLNFRREGSREHQGLTLLRGGIEDRVDLDREAHIKHTVRFVEDDETRVFEQARVAAQMVVHAARRADNQTRAVIKLLELFVHRFAADQQRGTNARAALDHLLGDIHHLHREFARRRQNDGGEGRIVDHRGNHRNAEGRGFAGTCLRGAENIAPVERERNGLRLNRRRRGVVHFCKASGQRGRQAEIFEIFDRHC